MSDNAEPVTITVGQIALTKIPSHVMAKVDYRQFRAPSALADYSERTNATRQQLLLPPAPTKHDDITTAMLEHIQQQLALLLAQRATSPKPTPPPNR